MVGGRAAVVVLDEDRVWLMRRRKGNEDYYVLPGGGIEPGEAKEETGLAAVCEDLFHHVR